MFITVVGITSFGPFQNSKNPNFFLFLFKHVLKAFFYLNIFLRHFSKNKLLAKKGKYRIFWTTSYILFHN